MITFLVKLICRFCGFIRGEAWRHSRPVEGNSIVMPFSEKIWWAYKYLVRPVEREERGSNIEEFFHTQDLSFAVDDGFVEEGSLTIGAGGDILNSQGILWENTGHLWDEVRDFYLRNDIVYANLEAPIVPSRPPLYLGKGIVSSPRMNGSVDMFERITDNGRGVNLFSTANNHCLDMGEEGLSATLDFLDSRGYPHFGTARSPEERDTPLLVERNGIRIGFIAWTFGTNLAKVPEDKPWLVNSLRLNRPETDISPIAGQADKARAAGADIVIACLHWSLEFESFPIRNVIETGHRIIESGVDVIIGNHAHVVQPIERYTVPGAAGKPGRNGLIIYALGDLVSNQRSAVNSRFGALARIRISRGRIGGERHVRVSSLSVLPTYHLAKMEGGRCVDFRLLDLRKAAAQVASGEAAGLYTRKTERSILRMAALCEKVLGPALIASAESTLPIPAPHT